MQVRDLTDEELRLIFDAVKPIFDRHRGSPEEAKAELRQIFAEVDAEAGKETNTDVQNVFLNAIDILAYKTKRSNGCARL